MEMIFVPGTGIIEDKVVPHCGDCLWFDEEGYENPDPELPELRIGFCLSWRRETQACGFCHCGIPKEREEEVSEMKDEIINMKITGTSITMADHGCITFWIDLEGGSCGVSYGGYCIGHGYLGAKSFDGSGKGVEAIARIMDTVGVERWEDLKGQYVRVVSQGWGGTITKIGNILSDKWFDIKEFFSGDSN